MAAARPTSPPRRLDDERYSFLSMRPLHILAFLAPLIVVYELGSAIYLTRGGGSLMETIAARKVLSDFFRLFGPTSLYLPGITLTVVLLVWHLIERDRWTIKPGVLAGMAFESILWVLPLLTLGIVLGSSHPTAAMAAAGDIVTSHPWQARLTLSIGAGLYEELLFRLILILLVHFFAVDLLRLRPMTGNILAVVVSALAFALYHDVPLQGGANLWLLGFYVIAGAYFGTIFLLRGFGIAVGCHALYDVIVLVAIADRMGQ